jgi:hypothetical protein
MTQSLAIRAGLAAFACTIAALVITGCVTVSYSTSLGKEYKPASDKAVLFGRFQKSGLHNFALVIENTSRTRQYLVQFQSTNDIAAIEVEPDTYEITQFVVADVINEQMGRIALKGWPYDARFIVRSQGAYYLSDFTGVYRNKPLNPQFTAEPNTIYRFSEGYGRFSWLTWQLGPVVDGFDSASAELLKTYPTLQGVLIGRAFPERRLPPKSTSTPNPALTTAGTAGGV